MEWKIRVKFLLTSLTYSWWLRSFISKSNNIHLSHITNFNTNYTKTIMFQITQNFTYLSYLSTKTIIIQNTKNFTCLSYLSTKTILFKTQKFLPIYHLYQLKQLWFKIYQNFTCLSSLSAKTIILQNRQNFKKHQQKVFLQCAAPALGLFDQGITVQVPESNAHPLRLGLISFQFPSKQTHLFLQKNKFWGLIIILYLIFNLLLTNSSVILWEFLLLDHRWLQRNGFWVLLYSHGISFPFLFLC